MSEGSTTGVRIDELKPHVLAILDEVHRAGPEACRAAWYEVRARVPERLQGLEVGSPSCAGLHVLAAVATQISIDKAIDGDFDGAINALIDSVEYQQAADACEAAAGGE